MPLLLTGALYAGIFSPCLPVKLGEIKDCGIDDVDRLLRPYIPTAYAQEVLGDDWESIAEKFMERREDNEDLWQFKEEFSSEKQLHVMILVQQPSISMLHGGVVSQEALIDNLELRDKLFMLSTSVVLLPDEEEENCFHFRFDMQVRKSWRKIHCCLVSTMTHDVLLRKLHLSMICLKKSRKGSMSCMRTTLSPGRSSFGDKKQWRGCR